VSTVTLRPLAHELSPDCGEEAESRSPRQVAERLIRESAPEEQL
jgi:hypothetical protein